jgi:hypothetical protein
MADERLNLSEQGVWATTPPENLVTALGFEPTPQALAILGGFIESALTPRDGRDEVNPDLARYYTIIATRHLEEATPPIPRLAPNGSSPSQLIF